MATTAAAAQPPGAVGSRGFHSLRIRTVVTETADACSFVFDVPDDLRATFAYAAGQFCTFRVEVDGERHLRCYSMSSAPGLDPDLQVTVKRVPGGVVSNWMHDALAAGDTIEVSPPAGGFRLRDGDASGEEAGEIVAFAAGSGITPVFSILKAGLAGSRRPFRMLYANRDAEATIFRRAIDALADEHADRLTVEHHLDIEHGFVDATTVQPFVAIDPATEYFICGPAPFMEVVERTLLDAGVATEQIHVERFTPGEAPEPPDAVDDTPTGTRVTIELGGRVEATDHRAGTTILQTARQLGLSPPFSCESGNCATCLGKLIEGEVTMRVNDVLTDDEVADGWVLTCQSVPTSPSVHVTYDHEEA